MRTKCVLKYQKSTHCVPNVNFADLFGSPDRHLSRFPRPFWGPLAAILEFAGGAVLPAVSQCPPHRQTVISTKLNTVLKVAFQICKLSLKIHQMTTTVPPLMFALLATEVFTVSKCATTVQYGLYCNSSLNYFIQNQFCNDKLNFVKIDNDCYHHLNLVLGEHESFLYDKVHFIFLSASHNGEGYQVYFSHIITKIKNSITIVFSCFLLALFLILVRRKKIAITRPIINKKKSTWGFIMWNSHLLSIPL